MTNNSFSLGRAREPDGTGTEGLGASIAVIGSGYVGLTTAACLASLGHRVDCSDCDNARVARLSAGEVPFVETGLARLLGQGIRSGRLTFCANNVAPASRARFVLLCLPTPQGIDGRADLSFVQSVAAEIGGALLPGSIVINKSTVPVGSARLVAATIGRGDISVVSNPEFLREGSAVDDFLHPDRIVIGADDAASALAVAALYSRLNARVIVTTPESAELVKYASNAFLATKLSFVNSMASLCEAVGADIRQVAVAMGHDTRIGGEFLQPGPGWGGSCFPKDTAALLRIAGDVGQEFGLLREAIAVNADQHARIVEKVRQVCAGRSDDCTVAVWGITFKAGTDDQRCSPVLEIIERLRLDGMAIRVYDPTMHHDAPGMTVCRDPYEACEHADVLLVGTDWDELLEADLGRVGAVMAQRAIVDSRNLFDPEEAARAGFSYQGVGFRPAGEASLAEGALA